MREGGLVGFGGGHSKKIGLKGGASRKKMKERGGVGRKNLQIEEKLCSFIYNKYAKTVPG